MPESSSSQLESNENDINRICLKSKNYFSHLNDPSEIRKAKIEVLKTQCLSKQNENKEPNIPAIPFFGHLQEFIDKQTKFEDIRPDGDPLKKRSECSEILVDMNEETKELINEVKILKRKHFSIIDNRRHKSQGDYEFANSDSPLLMSAISKEELSQKASSLVSVTTDDTGQTDKSEHLQNFGQKGDFYQSKTNLSELTHNKRYVRKAALQNSLKKCLTELDSLRSKNSLLQNQCDKLKKELREIGHLNSEKNDLKEKNAILEERIIELLNMLESKSNDIYEKDKHILTKDLAMQILQREIDEIQKENNNLQKELNKTQAEMKENLKLRSLDIKKDIEIKDLHNQLVDSRGKIRVIARFKPESNNVFEYLCDETVRINPSILTVEGKAKKIALNKIFVPDSSQEDIFNDIRPYITSAVDGFKVSLIAFGQVGSGKTYTMHGNSNYPGITGRLMHHILELMENRTQWNYSLKMSVLQVYNETVMDLLSHKVSFLTLIDDGVDVKIKGITEKPLSYVEDMLEYIQIGRRRRTTSKTIYHSNSSKSHLIILLHIEGKSVIDDKVTNGLLTLCDLAGFEKSTYGETTTVSTNEAKFIGKSLAALTRVLQGLQQNEKSIPYRDSKLTHVLKPSLTSDSKCALILTLSTLEENLNGSLRTLEIGQQVSSVCCKQSIKFESSSPPNKQLKITEKTKLEKAEKSTKVLYKFPSKVFSELM